MCDAFLRTKLGNFDLHCVWRENFGTILWWYLVERVVIAFSSSGALIAYISLSRSRMKKVSTNPVLSCYMIVNNTAAELS